MKLRAEEVHTPVRETRGEERHDLAVARVRIVQREADGVALDARAVVEFAVELFERATQAFGERGRDTATMRPNRLAARGAGLAGSRALVLPDSRGSTFHCHGAGRLCSISPHVVSRDPRYGGPVGLTIPASRDRVVAMKRIGIVGLGAIGRHVCRALDDGIAGLTLAAGTARDVDRAEAFLRTLRSKPPFMTLDDLIDASDLVIEASTQAHLREIAPRTLGRGRDLIVLSCGGLLGRTDWIALADANRCRILVPSAAIAGLDGVKGARVGEITGVTMETRKPPRGLAGAPWIVEQKIDLDAITTETLVFEGSATEACRAFPANVNVVAALSLAGVGPERTRIKIYAVPGLDVNQHRIAVQGEFGRLRIEVENVPSENPRTGKLSYLSTIALLRDLGASLRVGT